MAYETATALDANDLLDKLRIFALAQGWTVDNFALRSDSGGSGGKCLCLTKSGIVGAFWSDLGAGSVNDPGQKIGGYIYPSYSGGSGNMAQANGSGTMYTNGLGSTQYVAYHFFGGPTYLHVVVEVSTGTFKHFGIGQLDKFGTVTNGVYMFHSNWNYGTSYKNLADNGYHAMPWDSLESNAQSKSLVIRADMDAISPNYCNSNTGNYITLYRLSGGWRDNYSSGPAGPLYQVLRDYGASSITGRAPLWPLWQAALRGAALSSPLGAPPNLRGVRLDNLSPSDVITLGSDQWMVFPVIRKNGSAGDVNSGLYGYAYKK